MNYDHLSAKCFVTEDGVVRHKFARHTMLIGRPVSCTVKQTGHKVLCISILGKLRGISYARACWMLFHRKDIPPGLEIDHIDRNPSNNTKDNLRLADRSQHGCNQKRRNKSGHTGVYQTKDGMYEVQVWKHGRCYYGGKFHTICDAAKKRNLMAAELHGEFAL